MSTEQVVQQMVSGIKKEYDGVMPIEELQVFMNKCSMEELKELVAISCNQIGTALKGGDYKDPSEGMWYLNEGAHRLLKSYIKAKTTNA